MSSNQNAYRERIVIDPEIMAGKPIVKGTRIPVELVLKRLAQDLNFQTIFESYPRLTPDDVRACLDYARALVTSEEDFPAPTILSAAG